MAADIPDRRMLKVAQKKKMPRDESDKLNKQGKKDTNSGPRSFTALATPTLIFRLAFAH
jgi:hypothetical protein